MKRKVMCKRLGVESVGLEKPPFPGPLGVEIFENISEESWNEWAEMQMKVINEYRLDLSESKDRNKLLGQMLSFLKLSDGTEEKQDLLKVGTPT